MLAATGMRHTRHHMQQDRDGRVDAWLDDVPTAAEKTLSLFELAHPHRYAGKRPECWREHRAITQARALGQGQRITTPLTRAREGYVRRRKCLIGATRD